MIKYTRKHTHTQASTQNYIFNKNAFITARTFLRLMWQRDAIILTKSGKHAEIYFDKIIRTNYKHTVFLHYVHEFSAFFCRICMHVEFKRDTVALFNEIQTMNTKTNTAVLGETEFWNKLWNSVYFVDTDILYHQSWAEKKCAIMNSCEFKYGFDIDEIHNLHVKIRWHSCIAIITKVWHTHSHIHIHNIMNDIAGTY